MTDIIDHFMNYTANANLSSIAFSWLTHADRLGAGCSQCLKLAECFSIAVDFAKSGALWVTSPRLF